MTMLGADGNATVLLAGLINRSTLHELESDLHAVKEAGVKKLTLRVNSPGGSVTDGLAMYDLISALDCETRCEVAGMCASAATYPALACDTVCMTRNSTFMVHEPEGGMYGTLKQCKADLEFFEDLRARVFALYGSKTGMTPEEVGNFIDAPRFMNAEKALKLGFIDAIAGEEAKDGGQEEPAPAEPAEPQEAPAPAPEPENAGPELVDKKTLLSTLKDKCISFLSNDRAEAEKAEAAEGCEVPQVDNSLARRVDVLTRELEARDKALAELKNELSASVETMRNAVQVEVANRLAALGVDGGEVPAPRKGRMTNEEFKAGLANAYRVGGLDGGARFINEHS